MKSYVINRTGGPDVFELKDVPEPIASKGEIRIRVRALGISRLEVYIREAAWGQLSLRSALVSGRASRAARVNRLRPN